jgi:hypothetical protein
MPTAVEYAVMANPWHAQDLIEYALLAKAKDGIGWGGPTMSVSTALQQPALPGPTSADGQLAGVAVVPLLLVAVAVAVRRRLTYQTGSGRA